MEEYDWSQEHRLESLKKIYQKTIDETQSNIDWYTRNAAHKKQWAQRIRFFALVMLGVGTGIPVFADIFPFIPASVATLVIAGGTGLLALDRYMGHSTGWMRFLLTEMHLKNQLEDFYHRYRLDMLKLNEKEQLSLDDVVSQIQKCDAFRNEINRVIQDETQLWVKEFQNNSQTLDENFRNLNEITRSGTLTITVQDNENYSGGWDILVDGQYMETANDSRTTLRGLTSGSRQIRVNGKDSEQTILGTATKDIRISPGGHSEVVFNLSQMNGTKDEE